MQKNVPAAAVTREPRMGSLEWALLCVQSMLWGSAFFFAAIAIREIPALTITSFRLIPAAIILLGVCWWLGARLPATWREWRRFLAMGFANNVFPMLLILWAQREISGGIAAVFAATSPLFGLFIAHFFTQDEKLSGAKLAGIVTGICGVAVLVGGDLLSGSFANQLAKLALLASALCFAGSSIYVRRGFSQYPPHVVAVGQVCGSLAISLPLALIIDQPWSIPMPSWAAVGAVAGMGIFSSALSALCYFTLLRRAGAINAMLVTLLLPLTPITLGGLFLGETLTAREIAGAIIIALALLTIDGRVIGWFRRR